MLPSETMIWQPEFTDKTLSRKPGAVQYVDPVVHLPNVRALNRALRDAPWSALCYLRIPGMEMLVKNYG
ncbi:hypothetical protein KX462_28250, partial [Escherichia coli]|nr:hypothetical protein [Escherichia coli]